MYSIVPQNVCVKAPSFKCSLHNPKSVSFTCPNLSNKMFSGLRSLYTIPSECKCSTANTISDK